MLRGHAYVVTFYRLQSINVKKRPRTLEIPEDTIQNMGIYGSITWNTMMCIMCFDHNNCYYSSSEPVSDEEDKL